MAKRGRNQGTKAILAGLFVAVAVQWRAPFPSAHAAGAPPSPVEIPGVVGGETLAFPRLSLSLLDSGRYFATLRLELATGALTYDELAELRLAVNGLAPGGLLWGLDGYDARRGAEWTVSGGRVRLRLPLSQLRFSGLSFEIRGLLIHLLGGRLSLGVRLKHAVARASLVFEPVDADTWRQPRLVRDFVALPTPGRGSADFRIDFHAEPPVGYFECRFDGASHRPCPSSFHAKGLGGGEHRFVARGWSRSGLPSVPESGLRQRFTVTASPGTGILVHSVTPPDAVTASPRLRIDFTNTGDPKKPTSALCNLDEQPMYRCRSGEPFEGLLEGRHRIQLRSREDAEPFVYEWTVDRTPPTPNFSSTPAELVSSAAAAFAFAADDAVTFACALDDGAKAPCNSGTAAFDGLAEGPHVFRVVATDRAGNASTPLEFRWVRDATPPAVTLVTASPAQSPTALDTMDLAFTSSEPAKAECALDGADYAECSSPFLAAGLADGEHRVDLRLTDRAGNVLERRIHGWIVDRTAPVASIRLVDPAQMPTSQSSVTLELSTTESGRFVCSLDGSPEVECGPRVTYDELAEGVHRFRVVPFDVVGNAGPAANLAWTNDYTAPRLALGELSPPGALTNATSVSAAYTASEPAAVTCELDGAGAAPCSSPFVASGLAEGTHRLRLLASDAAGNLSAPLEHRWDIDVTAPVLVLLSVTPPEPVVIAGSMSFAFTSEEGATFACALDGAPATPCTSPYAFVAAEGAHHLLLEARDAAGNVSAAIPYSWVVDQSPPTVSLVSVTPSVSPTSSRTSTFVLESEPGATFRCALDGAEPVLCASPWTVSELAEGPHRVSFAARDGAGNPSSAVEYRWIVDTTAPAVQIVSAVPAGLLTSVPTMDFELASEAGAIFECALDGAAPAACPSPWRLSALAEGPHRVAIVARDLAGNVSAPALYAWTIDFLPPPLTLLSVTPAASPTSSRSLAVEFRSEPGAAFLCTLDGAAATPCTSPWILGGLVDGGHRLSIVAKDVVGNQSAPVAYSWVVDGTGPVLSLVSVNPAAPVTSARTISFAFTGEEGATFECSLDGTQTACGSPWTVSGLAEGPHQASIVARDATGNASAPLTHSWTVDATAPAIALATVTPAWTPIAFRTLSIGFTSESGATFQCSLDGGTAQACTSPWAISGLVDGPHRATIVARDAAGNASAPLSYPWTVDTSFTITNVAVLPQSPTSVIVAWRTNVASTSQVRYGKGALDQATALDGALTLNHSMRIDGIAPGVLYTAQPVSTVDTRVTLGDPVTFKTSN